MLCPFCRSAETRVVDSRSTEDGTAIRRRRLCPVLQSALHHRRDDEHAGGEALGRRRALQPGEGRRRRAQGVSGPPGERGRPGAPRPAGRGRPAGHRSGGHRHPRRRPGHPRPAAHPRRGGLPAVRLGLPVLRVPGRLRGRDRPAARRSRHRRASSPGTQRHLAQRAGPDPTSTSSTSAHPSIQPTRSPGRHRERRRTIEQESA